MAVPQIPIFRPYDTLLIELNSYLEQTATLGVGGLPTDDQDTAHVAENFAAGVFQDLSGPYMSARLDF